MLLNVNKGVSVYKKLIITRETAAILRKKLTLKRIPIHILRQNQRCKTEDDHALTQTRDKTISPGRLQRIHGPFVGGDIAIEEVVCAI